MVTLLRGSLFDSLRFAQIQMKNISSVISKRLPSITDNTQTSMAPGLYQYLDISSKTAKMKNDGKFSLFKMFC